MKKKKHKTSLNYAGQSLMAGFFFIYKLDMFNQNFYNVRCKIPVKKYMQFCVCLISNVTIFNFKCTASGFWQMVSVIAKSATSPPTGLANKRALNLTRRYPALRPSYCCVFVICDYHLFIIINFAVPIAS